jgi:hypothetical protein
MARLAERRMRHDDDDARVGPKRPIERLEDRRERVHVLDAEEEDGRIEGPGRQFRCVPQSPCVRKHEPAFAAMTAARGVDEPRTGVDADIRRSGGRDRGREDALPRPYVEDSLTGAWLEQVQGSRDDDGPVVGAAVLADPSVVPAGDVLPRGFSGRATRIRSGASRVPGHGRRR